MTSSPTCLPRRDHITIKANVESQKKGKAA